MSRVIPKLDKDVASCYLVEKELAASPGFRMLLASCRISGNRVVINERVTTADTHVDLLGQPVPLEIYCMVLLLGVPHIQQICAWQESNNCIYAITMWEEDMVNLKKALRSGIMCEVKAKAIFRSLVHALCCMVARNILYTNLKTENIWLSNEFLLGNTEECGLMITDFSSACLHNDNLFAYQIQYQGHILGDYLVSELYQHNFVGLTSDVFLQGLTADCKLCVCVCALCAEKCIPTPPR